MSSMFKKAERKNTKVKIALAGPPGSGKTYSALVLAKGMGGKTAVIDTENGSASLYSDRFEFDCVNLTPPYTTEKFIKAMNAAIEEGYENLIIDSISHQWAGSGGILDRKQDFDSKSKSGNSYISWKKFGKEHGDFVAEILNSPINILCTMRSKLHYEMQEVKGRMQPVATGMAPVQREGVEYEFSVVFNLDRENKALTVKDRTELFLGFEDILKEENGKQIYDWINKGAKSDPLAPAKEAAIGRLDMIPEDKREKALAAIKKAKTKKEMDAINAHIEQLVEVKGDINKELGV